MKLIDMPSAKCILLHDFKVVFVTLCVENASNVVSRTVCPFNAV